MKCPRCGATLISGTAGNTCPYCGWYEGAPTKINEIIDEISSAGIDFIMDE